MSCCDTLSEKINGLRIEISKLKNKEFDLECEVKRLREGIKSYLNLEIETHELKELIE